ncbi:hypothetical protein FQN54_008341 [Arachnomyces sp. PD_36]|nr:hypothetical protein FQN54_008341 [Arachnomyces sp. PD_36]
MLAGARAVKPTLSISTAVSQGAASSRPTLSLKSPAMMPRTPISPSPISPTARNTKLNQRGYSSFQQPTFSYVNQSSSKSILKKNQNQNSSMEKRIQFSGEPTVHCVTPIENPDDYYGSYVKMSREERRWGRRS